MVLCSTHPNPIWRSSSYFREPVVKYIFIEAFNKGYSVVSRQRRQLSTSAILAIPQELKSTNDIKMNLPLKTSKHNK